MCDCLVIPNVTVSYSVSKLCYICHISWPCLFVALETGDLAEKVSIYFLLSLG